MDEHMPGCASMATYVEDTPYDESLCNCLLGKQREEIERLREGNLALERIIGEQRDTILGYKENNGRLRAENKNLTSQVDYLRSIVRGPPFKALEGK